jgi:hypothetical protein
MLVGLWGFGKNLGNEKTSGGFSFNNPSFFEAMMLEVA